MWDMAHSICLIKLYQITMRKKFRFFVSDYLKPNIKFDRESKQDVKKPDMNKITYEEEKVALVLGMTTIFTVRWMFK